MQIHWFQNEDHLVYINGATQLADLERTLHFPGLEEAANALRRHPTPDGHPRGADHQGAQAHQRPPVRAGPDLRPAHPDGGEYLLLYG